LITLHRYYGGTRSVVEHQTVLEQQFSTGSGIGATKEHVAPPPGWAVARLIIPKLKQKWIVVEGTTDADIANAPGHYTGTALPGQRGNFAVAGHRSPAIFSDLDELHDGDIIQVDVNVGGGKVKRYTYVMVNSEVVTPDRLDVIAANPVNPDAKATKKLLTLTTCDPWWDRTHRLIVRAELTKTETLHVG
jgi:sortase A